MLLVFLVNNLPFFLWNLFKKGVTIVNTFQSVSDNSRRKPNRIWVDKESEFYKNSFKKWLKDSDVEMYSIQNEEKIVVAKIFIRNLKN